MNAAAEDLAPELQREVDGLRQEAAQLDAPSATEAPGAPAGEEAAIPQSWRPVAEYCYKVFSAMGTNWEFSGTAQMMIVDGGTELLDRYFPGGPTMWQQWGPWAKLLAGIGVLGFLNIDPATKRFKVFARQKKQDTKKDEGRNADSGGGSDAQRQDSEHPPGGTASIPAAGVRPKG